ncbi:MAG: beta-lactamase family protein [Candidatus Margulisbacteria bacterium]|jgi:D-alanyl-D-alanine carboxypeptidase|nr:beta-lactamase family protein [Candidatus Margulisiibacteriota bacterium]
MLPIENILKSSLIFGCLLAAVCLVGCATLSGSGSQYQTDLQNLVTSQWASYGSGKANWGGGVGLYIMSPKGKYFAASGLVAGADENIHFRGYSTTKSFTAVAIMLLQQQGKLNIDDKITALIPGSTETYVPGDANYNIPNKDQITIRQLLGHKAGVFDVGNNIIPTTEAVPYAGQRYIDYVKEVVPDPDHTFTFDELVGVAATCELSDFAPGTRFHYSNTGYWIIGKIVERVSGQRLYEFVRDALLLPNGLTATSFPYLGTDQTVPAPFTPGYGWAGGTILDLTVENVSGFVAEGNIITTPADLANWCQKWITGRSGLSQTSVDQMMDCQPTGEEHRFYGLGCNYTPGLGYGHNGGHPNYLTVMRHDPSQEVTVVVFCSAVNIEDLYGEVNFMYDLGFKAKELLGYPTAEASP